MQSSRNVILGFLIINEVFDVKSVSVNDLITPNRNLKIRRYKVKIAGDKPANGIIFVNLANNERIKVDVSDIATNNPSELIIVTQPLNAGTYQAEITSQFSSGVLLKEPRVFLFDKVLTVH